MSTMVNGAKAASRQGNNRARDGADMRMASRLYPSNIEQALPAFRWLYLGARMANKLIESGVDIGRTSLMVFHRSVGEEQ
jgi:hypothetical protein